MAKRREKNPTLRILLGAAVALGPGKVALLEAVDRTGSITGAAREMGMSYRRAWKLIDAMNSDFISPLVVTNAGGSGGGGAQVTEAGFDALTRYRSMEDKAGQAVRQEISDFATLLNPSPKN
ncbi:MAG: winged helix-turn-helix domain-containing protein [Alphaproteobacteria bacterium]